MLVIQRTGSGAEQMVHSILITVSIMLDVNQAYSNETILTLFWSRSISEIFGIDSIFYGSDISGGSPMCAAKDLKTHWKNWSVPQEHIYVWQQSQMLSNFEIFARNLIEVFDSTLIVILKQIAMNKFDGWSTEHCACTTEQELVVIPYKAKKKTSQRICVDSVMMFVDDVFLPNSSSNPSYSKVQADLRI